MTGPKLRLLVVMSLMNGALIGAAPAVSAQAVDGYLSGTITDALSGNHVEEGCAVAHDTATTDLRAAPFVGIAGSDRTGAYSLALAPGDYYISFADCLNWDYKWRWYGGDTPVKVTIAAGLTTNVDFALQPADPEARPTSRFHDENAVDLVIILSAGGLSRCRELPQRRDPKHQQLHLRSEPFDRGLGCQHHHPDDRSGPLGVL